MEDVKKIVVGKITNEEHRNLFNQIFDFYQSNGNEELTKQFEAILEDFKAINKLILPPSQEISEEK